MSLVYAESVPAYTRWVSETTALADLERPAGNFEVVEHRGERLFLSGWMLQPGSGPFDEIRVFWNGESRGPANRDPRPDLSIALPWIERAADGGFSVELDLGSEQRGLAELIGYLGDRPAARHSTLAWPPSHNSTPLPPRELIEHVSPAPSIFEAQGLKAFTDLIEQVDRHANQEEIGNMLDWGCGCGRSTRYLLDAGLGQIHGCDIDSEAISWCQRELGPGQFVTVGTEPPTPYVAESMDLIIGVSVFIHLSRADQGKWLRELQRITSPGGLILVSVHGEYAYRFIYGGPPSGRAEGGRARLRRMRRAMSLRRMRRAMSLKRNGIVDADNDPMLGGVAPSGYYRLTYQTRDYTIREWGKFFEIVDYLERGLCGHQDLVVMRRRA